MQQPQSRPLLGDSVSSTTSPNARHNNPVTVLTQQQLQQLQQLQAQNSSGQSLTFALQQTSSNPQEQGNGSATGNHIVYLNQLNQLNQSTINPSGTGMGLPPATPTFGVGLNMGLPLSLINTNFTSLTSNVITTTNPLQNLGLPSISTGPSITTINPSLNQLNAINSNLTSNLGSNSINNSLSNLGQDLNSINTGVNTGINRLNTINSTNINSGLSGVSTGLTGPNLTNLNSSSVNQNLATLNTNLTVANSGVSGLSAINPTTNLTATSINSGVNQGLNRPANALATSLTPTSLTSSSAQFPFQAIQSIQTLAPHIVASSNIAHVPNSGISQHPNSNISTISQISNSGTSSSSIFTSTPSESIHTTTANVNHASNVNLTTNIPHLGTMHPNLSNISTSNVQHISASNEPIMSLSHVSSLSSSQSPGFQPQRQYSQGISPGLSASVALTGTTQPSNVVSTMNTVKSMQNIQGQNISSPGSPFSMPLKSPASNIAPPTPSPSPNRLLLRSPASNSIQSNRNSPSPVSTSTSNSNFNMQMQSPMQSPMSVSQIQSPVLSPYPPAKSPHLLSGNNSLNNRSPAPGGSPGPPVVRPNTPILQQGMQVLQIIHGTPQGYQSTPTQLVTRTQLFGNQQIQIAAAASAAKPTKQPPQILPKPPNQQTNTSQQKSQRATTTITNQVTQQSQPQIVLAGPQPSPTTATMIPTAQGLLLNQVLPSTGPVIVQQQPGGVQLILRTPAGAQQQTHTAQLTQQQLVRVVTAQGMQLQGIAPTFFAVPNGFPPAASPVIRHTPSSPAPSNSGTSNPIVIQNAMVQSPQSQISQVTSGNTTGNAPCTQPVSEQNLLPPPKKKAKKKKKAKRKDDEPKLDLARIIKISGIGDDDDIFDSELTTETEVPCQIQQSETNSGQSLGQISSQGTVPVSSALTQVPATNTTNTQASVSQSPNNQLVTQLQMPVQNALTGQFRLSIGEDGKQLILHHTPEPNQPEIDSATAQALIRSLTQGSGQNSQIISQFFSQAQNTPQSTQNTTQQRQKYVKSPLSSGNQASTNTISSACSQNVISTTSPHHGQICSKPINQQKNISVVSQETNSLPNICIQSSLGTLQETQTSKNVNVNVQNLMQAKNVQTTLSQTSNNTLLNAPDVLSTKSSPIFSIQGTRMSNASQTSSNQQNSNLSLQKSSQVRLVNACITNVRQNLGKQPSQQHGAHMQKSVASSSLAQNDHISKTNQSLQQTSQQETLTLQQESPLFQHNQQITAQTVQTQNVQQIFEQNLQSSNIHHNSMNILQQQSSCNTMQQHDTMNVLHSSIQQNTINVLQQNTADNVQNIEQNLQSGIKDIAHAQQNIMTNLQQQNTSAVLHNTSVQQNVNVQQQKVVTANTFSSVNAHHFESQNAANVVQQGINTQQNNQNQNILITTTPTSNTTQHNESQNVESQGANILNSAANNILNNAPKLTPEILNTLRNLTLNPSDQLLIANANGQMQLIPQQFLQQLLAGQLNTTNQTQQNQNQTQKIVIGEPDANNQNLQGVQINTPTSQIIVNSSGGAPTIQNNIQNIVVQAAPSQIPQHIQIQNSGFPSQFIDNLNQQQIRNLGNNQPKKAKVVKKTKVAVTAQSINSQTKTVTVTRPTMVTTNTSNLQKVDHSNKTSTTVSHSTNLTKSEPTQIIANGPLVSSSAGSHVSVPSNGQMVQRVQTIQLPAQLQQSLKNIQSQIQAIISRKSGTPHDQTALAKLYQEQAKILASGKVVSTTTHSVNSTTETTFSVNVVSTVASTIHSQNSFKNQTSAAQTQTSTAAMPVTSQTLNPTTSVTIPSSSNNSYINNITVPQSVQGQQPNISNTVTQSMHQAHTTKQQHKFYQNHGTQILNPSSANMQIFSPPSVTTPQLQNNAQQLAQAQTQQQTGIQCQQQSTQCQTDPLDFKPNIQTPSPVKQELSSPIQVQVQSGSPASQVTSPRMISKGTQRIQSPVNTNGNTMKQLVSPNGNSNALISPRQAIKRRATSPICRQMNRGDLVEQQLKMDQNGATNPDMNTPFTSKRDACKRLVRYHCMNEQVLGPKDLTKADEIFEETAKHLLSKFSSMINKYTYLLLMESMREVRTSELMMIDRTFVAEEQSILNRLREQEAKLNEECKKEEKPLVPKVEPGLGEENKSTLTTSSPLVNVSVKRELEDDFPNEEMECKPVIKTTSSTSGDYDEWLEIQKELGVYPSTADTLKCKNGNNSGSSACAVTRSSKIERTRANGECLRTNVANMNASPGVSNMIMKDDCEQDVNTPFDRRWSSATDLERDLSEDTDLDGLALHSQTQCSSSTAHVTSSESENPGNEHDEINAQVQSAIDSILNLKQRPTNTLSGSSSGSNSSSQSGDSKDTALDQAVRSILGS
ncbi:mucin-17 isoform X1 [Solenopsis invicta]|uniref:mucin-17 isoform X1 n=1 Tax=Solenopsis invicta TaxID=13686 RepID=UPI00059614D7|nr:mucin-17 isoform X1 [Solenopsis invicta]XP_025991702.1 mucin-17 isoform X1 [Solenopsis invicta]XP_039309461.1 mucin-17 isoform X1 [Solenopsis invicta]